LKHISNAYKLYLTVSTDSHLKIEYAKNPLQIVTKIWDNYTKAGYDFDKEAIRYKEDFIILKIQEKCSDLNNDLYWLIQETQSPYISAQDQNYLITVIHLNIF
jgi:hypothetical protein